MSPHKIMVVDDNAAIRQMVKTALGKRGHVVVEAETGSAARALMTTERPRLVLQDLMLPDADGFELVGELRALAHTEVTILAFSGFVSKLDEARVSTVGFDDIIPKPIAPSRLVSLVEGHLAAASLPDQFGAGRRLVVADDDPLQLKLAVFRLGRLGFEIEPVADGAAALAAIRRRPPDAIVSDVMMPELDGFGLAMALRQDPRLQSLPLLLVTSSYIEPSDRELAHRSGATEFVLRTPDLAELIELLRTTVTRKHAPAGFTPESLPELERERSRRVFRQLERQVMLNSGLAKRCSELASELTVLNGIADAVLKHRDIDVALDESLSSCFDASGVSLGALYLLDAAAALRVRMLGSDVSSSLMDQGGLPTFFGREALLRTVMGSGQPLHVPSSEIADDIAADLLAKCGATAILVVPLTSAAGPLGALLMVARDRALDQDDWRAFAVGVGMQISQVLTLARAYADREAAEQRAAGQAALLEAIFESAPDSVLQIGLDGMIQFINRTQPPVTMEQVIGTHWLESVAPEQRARASRVFDAVVATGKPGEYEIEATPSDGIRRWFHGRLGAVKQDGKIVGCVLIASDITDRKQTELQLMLADRMASVGTLAAGVAHEINNPLAAVIANLDMAVHDVLMLAKRVELPADLTDGLQDARASADRVREIVRDLKVFSRVQDDVRGPVDVEKVLESTLRMAWNELRHRAKVVKRYGKVPRVDANESRLGQVFLNLIVNAVQAMPEGKFDVNEIRIATTYDADSVAITVGDTGVGIPPEARRMLFTPFFTTKPIGVGTGLGLAISHRIITSLGGTLTFESELGKGTEFRIALPISGVPLAPAVARVPTAPIVVRRGRVLVIDDEETLAHAIRRYLSQDHEVDAVTSARAALDMFALGARFDVILCDLMMPQITGMELYGVVEKLDPAQAAKMVFVTGGVFTQSAREFLDAAPNPRIEKPFDLKTLRHLVNGLIG